jgi:glycosyltransferase involved in cell wall biosynthesis
MVSVSLIIPVYNVEKYLSRCLESCLRQDLNDREYEIIVVNDGSCDDSLSILKEYTNKYQHIVLIDKPNGGLSSARNAGLKKARGELVWFIDSDDWIEDNCLRTICCLFEKNNIDMMAFNTYYATDNGYREQEVKRNINDGEILNGMKLYNRGFIYPFTGVPFYIYKHSFLKKNNLYFVEGICFEDWLFTPIVYVYCERCLYLDRSLYYYYMREGSITQSRPSVKKVLDVIKVAEGLFDKIAIISHQKSIIVYKSVACLSKAFYDQWYYLNATDRNFSRKMFFKKKYWMISILCSCKLKYIIIYVALLTNLRIARLAKYNR